ncbi:hypothetical protein PQ455_00750 [Sphingomonas naphthae]|uniref:Bacteriophage Mu GpT domain-containing protein n=1 Tax=Sphingomonas naphthae TaxID=1813468 RepID=A0ABY7TN14_9SPHN|nr:prohead protease/major capsid protein fusion protein [Sphingomonas naphthae]WCT73795.1 hypothetical protein PQ455_00750 [Sphingomonas naphthae]
MSHNRTRTLAPTPAPRRPDGQLIADVLDRITARRTAGESQSASPHAERRVAAPQGQRTLSLQPASWNAEARTIDVVWTTGARGVRFDFDTLALVDEELATGTANVRLDRLNRGAPVLNTHQKDDLGAQIGTVVPGSARMVGGQGIATLQLSAREDVAPIVADIAAGIIRNLSVGYTVHVFEVNRKASPRPLYRATDWEPTEISFVPVPFDAGAQVRDLPSHPGATCLVRTIPFQEPKAMSTSWMSRFTRAFIPAAPPAAAPAPTAPAEPSYERQASIAWLRDYTRMASETMTLPPELAADLALEMAERSMTEGQARDAVMQILGERQRNATGTISSVNGSPVANALIYGERSYDNPDFQAAAIGDALFARMSGSAPTEQARKFMNMSMVQIAGELMIRQGVRDVNRMGPNEILNSAAWNSGGTRSFAPDHGYARGLGGMHTTSDFPQLLMGAGERFLLTVFEAAASPLKQISRQRSARDFRAISGLQLSGFGTLLEVPDAGEIKHGTFKERKETYRLKTFAKQFALSRQAIINDDLNVFSDPITIMGRASAETEATLLADLINSNPALSDGIPLFDAQHGNLAATGAAPTSIGPLDAGRLAMRRQKDLDGKTPLAPAPKFIVSSVENETRIEQLLTMLQATTTDAANPFAGKLTPLVDPRLDPLPWYLFGAPGSAPMLEHAYLNDQAGPKVEMQDGWDVLGTKFRVYMDFGAGVVDWRGGYKNPGAAG